MGATGVTIGAAIVGLADVDAVSVAMARGAADINTTRQPPSRSMHVAYDTVSKIAIGAVIGRGWSGVRFQ